MISSINEFSYRLNQIDLSETGKVADSLREILQQTSPDTLRKAHKTIFRFFEDHPNVQLLGHFVDIFDAHFPCYTNELVDSMDRKPSTSTLLMVNRHLNDDLNDDLRDRLMKCLQKASFNDNASETIRKEASEYFERQNHLEWNDLVLPVADRKAPDSAMITASTKKLRGRYVILRGFMVRIFVSTDANFFIAESREVGQTAVSEALPNLRVVRYTSAGGAIHSIRVLNRRRQSQIC